MENKATMLNKGKLSLTEIYDVLEEKNTFPLFSTLWKSYKEATGLEGWLKNTSDELFLSSKQAIRDFLDASKKDEQSDIGMCALNLIFMRNDDFSMKVPYKKIISQISYMDMIFTAEMLVRLGVATTKFKKVSYFHKDMDMFSKEMNLQAFNIDFILKTDLLLLKCLAQTYKDGKFLVDYLKSIPDSLLISTLSDFYFRVKDKKQQASHDFQLTCAFYMYLDGAIPDVKDKIDHAIEQMLVYLHLEFLMRTKSLDESFYKQNSWGFSCNGNLVDNILSSRFVRDNHIEELANRIRKHFNLDDIKRK